MCLSLFNDSIEQGKRVAPFLAVTYAVILLGLLIPIYIMGTQLDIPMAKFTRDPAAIFRFHPFTGVLSHLGILVWCATSAICFFTSVLLAKKGNILFGKFLLVSGLVTSFLLLDDLFMFHEFVFPKLLHIPQKAVYVGYLVLMFMFFMTFKSIIIQTEYTLLFAACLFFGLSIICDVFLPQRGIEYLVEDGFKIIGIVTWAIFFARTCINQTQKMMAG